MYTLNSNFRALVGIANRTAEPISRLVVWIQSSLLRLEHAAEEKEKQKPSLTKANGEEVLKALRLHPRLQRAGLCKKLLLPLLGKEKKKKKRIANAMMDEPYRCRRCHAVMIYFYNSLCALPCVPGILFVNNRWNYLSSY